MWRIITTDFPRMLSQILKIHMDVLHIDKLSVN